jgi:hypothetical protein
LSTRESSAPYWDIEVKTLTLMLHSGMWKPHEVSAIRRQLDIRKQEIMGGLGSPSQIYWTARLRKEVDECCRVRRDPVEGWMLDRWVEQLGCWHPVGYIGTGGHAERVPKMNQMGILVDTIVVEDDKVRPDLVAFLKARDMRRPGYIQEKRERAAKIQKDNEKAATDKVKAAVDSLSSKAISNFIAVERAIQTGETVTMHGQDMKSFERMTDAGKKALPGPQSSNPEMHPKRLRRDYASGKYEREGS